jgi:hypothetical protein
MLLQAHSDSTACNTGVHHLQPSDYSPIMAIVLPVGGILGGVGGGWIADKIAAEAAARGGAGAGRRALVTAGTNFLAAPLMTYAFLTQDVHQSFLALMAGYAMSEGWRAPSGNMAR